MSETKLARWRLTWTTRGAALLWLSLLGYGCGGVGIVSAASNEPAQDVAWPAYSGHVSGDHYSELAQINRSNVKRLRLAWTYDTGEGGSIETNPVIVGRTLYGYTASQKVIALDAATGALQWKFDSGIKGSQPARGLVYMADGKNGVIFAGVMNYLYKLDASTGRPITSFGEEGRVDLRKNLRGDYLQNFIALTTPGVVYKDLIIVGGRDPETLPAPPGDIRAYDVNTGALRWAFHTIPHPGEPGYETWSKDSYQKVGAANDWAGMALDEKRGIAYIPTGSAAFDFYGGDRIGNNLYANSLLALDASTGKLIWFFQGVHHDLWDRDFPAHPVLLTIKHNGRSVDAVAQISKQGFLFVFDRTNGTPLFPIQEKPVPQTDLPGEVTSKTQPFPVGIEPFARQRLTEDMLTNRTPEVHAWAVNEFRKMRNEGQFTPLELARRTIFLPGFDGGGEWGGPAVDPTAGVIYINASDSPWTGGLEAFEADGGPGAQIYRSQCGICHGKNRAGAGLDFPGLVGIGSRMTDGQIADQVHNGKGRMPAFPAIDDGQMQQLIAFLKTSPVLLNPAAPASSHGGPAHTVEPAPTPSTGRERTAGDYEFTGYFKFEDPDGYPAVKPPWGTLNAINLNTGKYLFKVTLGEYPDLIAQGLAPTGSENYGGPVVTAGGLVFVAATLYDRKLRAFDSKSGELLWQGLMPGSGVATPATYSVDGKQYVVVPTSATRDPGSRHAAAPGGEPEYFGTNAYTYTGGGSYVAFALP
jgi:quinoprotein glucose dehydrogenase